MGWLLLGIVIVVIVVAVNANIKGNNDNNKGDSIFSEEAIAFGNSLRNNAMIEDIALKMIVMCERNIRLSIEKTYENSFTENYSFSVDKIGISLSSLYDRSPEILFKDYGYAPITEQEKINGIAWILQDLLYRHLLDNNKEINNISIKASREMDDWTSVKLIISITTISKYKKL